MRDFLSGGLSFPLMHRNISRAGRVSCPLYSSRPPTFVDVPLDGFIIAGFRRGCGEFLLSRRFSFSRRESCAIFPSVYQKLHNRHSFHPTLRLVYQKTAYPHNSKHAATQLAIRHFLWFIHSANPPHRSTAHLLCIPCSVPPNTIELPHQKNKPSPSP